jgi:hypothetical protein
VNAKELAEKFLAKVAVAGAERDRQKAVAADNTNKRLNDAEYCKTAMTNNVIPLLSELETYLPNEQFSFAPQIDLKDHRVTGVSFRIGDGPTTTISTALGNVIVTHAGASGSSKGVSAVHSPDTEPYISNSGDLTRGKIARLIEMVIDDV